MEPGEKLLKKLEHWGQDIMQEIFVYKGKALLIYFFASVQLKSAMSLDELIGLLVWAFEGRSFSDFLFPREAA